MLFSRCRCKVLPSQVLQVSPGVGRSTCGALGWNCLLRGCVCGGGGGGGGVMGRRVYLL